MHARTHTHKRARAPINLHCGSGAGAWQQLSGNHLLKVIMGKEKEVRRSLEKAASSSSTGPPQHNQAADTCTLTLIGLTGLILSSAMLWPRSPAASAELGDFSRVPNGTLPLARINARDLMPTSWGGVIPERTRLLCCHVPEGTLVFSLQLHLRGDLSRLKGPDWTASGAF